MMTVPQIHEGDKFNFAPKKFNMWLFIFTSFMFFAALTSAFIVYSSRPGYSLKMALPQAFLYSSGVIVLSSLTIILASRAAKRSNFAAQRMYLWLTVLLGLLFFVLQVYAWSVMVHMGVYIVNPNASQSFVYIFTGAHLAHIIAGLSLLIYALHGSYKSLPQVKNLFRMEFAAIFWHFLDIVWIYLYVFLLLNQY